MKNFIRKIDFLWIGDRDVIQTMWLSILLAIVSVVSAVVSGYIALFT